VLSFAARSRCASTKQHSVLYGFQVPDKLDNWTLEKPLDFRARKRKCRNRTSWNLLRKTSPGTGVESRCGAVVWVTGYLLDRTGLFYWAFVIVTTVALAGAASWLFLIGPIVPVI
jgi:hypothetical protein